MDFFNPTSFNREQAEAEANPYLIPKGLHLAVINKADPTEAVTGPESKYAGQPYKYLDFECDVMVNGRAITFKDRFMVDHALKHQEDMQGLVARGQINLFKLLEVFGLHTQMLPPEQYNQAFRGKNVMVDIGVKRDKDAKYPNFLRGFEPVQQQTAQTDTPPAANYQQQQPQQQVPVQQTPAPTPVNSAPQQPVNTNPFTAQQ